MRPRNNNRRVAVSERAVILYADSRNNFGPPNRLRIECTQILPSWCSVRLISSFHALSVESRRKTFSSPYKPRGQLSTSVYLKECCFDARARARMRLLLPPSFNLQAAVQRGPESASDGGSLDATFDASHSLCFGKFGRTPTKYAYKGLRDN